MEVNGKVYPFWGQFVEQKEDWIGGILEDFGDSFNRQFDNPMKTKIVDVTLEPDGKDSAFFSIKGEDFTCGFGVKYGGITAGEESWITFYGYGGHKWRIKNKLETK